MKKKLLLLLSLVLLLIACEKEYWETYEGIAAYRTDWHTNYAKDNIMDIKASTYHEWAEPVYTYKSYTGEPHIDSEAFYESLSGCSVWYTPYDNITELYILEELAEKGDSMAMLRIAMIAGTRPWHYYFPDWEYLRKAANLGNLNTHIIIWKDDKKLIYTYPKTNTIRMGGPYYNQLEIYAQLAPLALYVITKDMKMEDGARDLTANYIALRKAGNDPYILGYSAANMYRLGLAEEVDKDNLCEAYFQGCDWLYDIKKNIICGQ